MFYGAEIVLGLDFVHQEGVIYNDLKPENVLIDGDGHIQLADFGISHQLATKSGERVHRTLGTAHYMPPEAFVNAKGYNIKFDVWSLGCCLYEIVVGHPPFGQHDVDAEYLKM